MGRTWSFRADDELDPILEKWSKQHEKSFHIRQALRLYRAKGSGFVYDEHIQVMPTYEEEKEVELCLDDWA